MSTTDSNAKAEGQRRWDGYSDYKTISDSIARQINAANAAHADIKARHKQGARLTRDRAASAESHIFAAIHQLKHEIRREKDSNDELGEIWDRWTEGGEEFDQGLLDKLDQTYLVNDCPEWVGTLVDDIYQAGWELGYIAAGRTESGPDPSDPHDGEVLDMIEGM